MNVRVRIPPSPTGEPHIGTAYTALFNFAFAKKEHGEFILRIEDTDKSRFVPGTEKKIIDSLKWLGLNWNEGPDISGPYAPYRQSERLDKYRKFSEELVRNKKAYYCDCSTDRLKEVRLGQQRKGEVSRYDRKCRNSKLTRSEDTVLRLAIPLEGTTSFKDEVRGDITFQNQEIDDQVLLKSDGYPTYHLASVVDDHLMKISHVIRAEEWLSSTPKHVLLYQAFGWKPPKFIHLPLLRNPDKSKISKRKNSISLIWYREQGYLPEALLNYLATMGWSMPGDKEIFSLDEFISNFSFDRIDPAGPIFDIQKLDWMNGEYIRKTDNEALVRVLQNYTKTKKEDIERVLPLVKERMKKISEFDELTSYFFKEKIPVNSSVIIQTSVSSTATVRALKGIENSFSKISKWNRSVIEKVLNKELSKSDLSKRDLFQTVRGTVAGTNATPPLFETLEEIGKDKVVDRLGTAVDELSK